MSSLVTEILSSAGKLEKEDLGNKLVALIGSIENFKAQVQEILLNRYVNFVPLAKSNENLEVKVTKFTSEIRTLKNVIENELVGQIRESADEFKEINTQLEVTESTLEVVNMLVALHDALPQLKNSIRVCDFLEATHCLERVKQMMTSLKASWTGQNKLLDGLVQEYLLHCECLKYGMEETWKESVKWSINESSETNETKGKSVQLTITDSGERLQSLTRAMHFMHHLDSVLKRFTVRLNEHMIHPIITQKTAVSEVDGDKASFTLVVSTKDAAAKKKLLPQEVFPKLTTTFAFLHKAFGAVTISEGEGVEVCLINRIGGMIYKDFCQVLIQECLSKAVPSHRKDLSTYDRVVEATTQFHETLSSLGIASQSDESLIHYAQNVDTLFANKMCRDLLGKAKKIMMEDLYDSLEPQFCQAPHNNQTDFSTMPDLSIVKQEQETFGGVSIVKQEQTFGGVSELDELTIEDNSQKYLMRFPKCHISKSAQKLVDMLYSIMEEASNSSEQCAARLFTTARNIIHLYCDMMPCFHKDSLESLPQQSALFHNNCMFIAHHLITLGHQFRSKLPLPFSDSTVTFFDLVQKVRSLAIEVFLAQMRIQRKLLIGILVDAGDFRNIIGETKFVSMVERAIKQCLLQLEHLRKVWHGTLPLNVCHKALGTLLNTLIEEIISRVTSLEDLPAVNATDLIAALGVIKERAPGLFECSDPNSAAVELPKYIPKWMKFQELLLVLAATMQDILDRWASGKGPLAQEFTVDEAKQLIRALFQNTDRRAAVLSKIK